MMPFRYDIAPQPAPKYPLTLNITYRFDREGEHIEAEIRYSDDTSETLRVNTVEEANQHYLLRQAEAQAEAKSGPQFTLTPKERGIRRLKVWVEEEVMSPYTFKPETVRVQRWEDVYCPTLWEHLD